MMKIEQFELKPEELSSRCGEEEFSFPTTKELERLDEIVGQERGLRALDFGVDVAGDGYNIFVLGPKGSGRNSAAKKVLKERAARQPVSQDWCYVNNFQNEYQPVAIGLPGGKGAEFRHDMSELIQELQSQLEQTFESESYRRRRDSVTESYQEEQNKEFSRLQNKAREAGFAVQRSGGLFGIVPLRDGKPLEREEYEKLPDEEKEQIEEKGKEIRQELNDAMKKARQAEKNATEAVRELDRKMASIAVEHAVNEMKEKYDDHEKILSYLDAVKEFVVDNVHEFLSSDQEGQAAAIPGLAAMKRQQVEEKFTVNLVVDNRGQNGAPAVFETNPTYANLIGRIEHKAQFGALTTDFTMLKAGALHRANGGYLVLQAFEVLTNFMAWRALKRCLKNKEIKIEDLNEQFRLISTVTLQPEPIPLNVKIVLVGQPFLFYLLYALDEDFSKLFKVKADFDDLIKKTDDNVQTYARFVSTICDENKLPAFDKSALGRIVEHSSRLAGDQEKLSATLSNVADLVYEAAFWANREGNRTVKADDVDKAIGEKVYRSNRIEERIREMIERDVILIDHTGEKVGQVNGIAVLSLGDYMFGKPTRITTRAFSGRGGVVHIDREAKLSGRIHNKGVFILTGYLGGKYALNKPMNLSATIGFEQLYEEVEGDSASSAELYALLSAIGNIPIRQDIAVTGSVNQHGEVQPVGAVTQKVEGFYDVCRIKGLTQTQGVIIPRRNVKNLNLRPDVREAVEKGDFHVYAVNHIEEGFSILTGQEPGELQPDFTYPEGTFNHKIDSALARFAQVSKRYPGGESSPLQEREKDEEK